MEPPSTPPLLNRSHKIFTELKKKKKTLTIKTNPYHQVSVIKKSSATIGCVFRKMHLELRSGQTHGDTVIKTRAQRPFPPRVTQQKVSGTFCTFCSEPTSWLVFCFLVQITLDSNAVLELSAWPWIPALHKVADFWLSLCYKSHSPTIRPMIHLSTRLAP